MIGKIVLKRVGGYDPNKPRAKKNRCVNCGIDGHTESECELKKEGDRILKREAARRKK